MIVGVVRRAVPLRTGEVGYKLTGGVGQLANLLL
jgi:hypothetical protein